MFEIPWIKWFMAGNIYSGSIRLESGLDCFQYRVKMEKEEKILRAWAWAGPNCLAATPEEKVQAQDFPLDEQGREALIAWLTEVRKQFS